MKIRQYSLVNENKKVLLEGLKYYYEQINGESVINKLEKYKLGLKILEYIKSIVEIEDITKYKLLKNIMNI